MKTRKTSGVVGCRSKPLHPMVLETTSSERLANAHGKRKGRERENRTELEWTSNEKAKRRRRRKVRYYNSISRLLWIVRNEPTTRPTQFSNSAYRKPPCVPGFLSLSELRCHAASCPRRTSELGWPSWSIFMGSLFVQLFVHTLLKLLRSFSSYHLTSSNWKVKVKHGVKLLRILCS